MNILIACEKTGVVRDAFARRGHHAVSADPLGTDVPGSHYYGDVQDIMYDKIWDMIIAFPPCTYLCNTGVQHLFKKPDRLRKMYKAVRFFKLFLEHECEKVVIENPIMHGYAKDRIGVNQTQIIQPFMFGHMRRKSTCLWLKGVPLLVETNNVREEMLKLPMTEQKEIFYMGRSKDRSEIRSKTFPGIAEAMSKQWG